MRVVETKIYTFEELSPAAKAVAIEEHRDINTHDGWWEPIFEGITEEAEAKGFHVGNIYFSGFWSQGDGAMFEYTTLGDTLLNNFVDQLDLSPMRKSWLRTQTFAQSEGTHRGHYYHENCCSHNIDFESNFGYNFAYVNFYNWINSFADQYEEFVIAEYKTLCRELYSRLSKYNDELTSDEEVADTIIMNEWEFDVDGNNFH
jgi:hypothetical protein